MTARFEELDSVATPMGVISLRRRFDPSLEVEVFEARLGDEFLMSSLFTVAEIALATLGLAEVRVDGDALDVVVGGLGLGYTAKAVLEDPRVTSLRVVEALPEVISWHERGLLPMSAALTRDDRCSFVPADFFAEVAGGNGFGAAAPKGFHAVLVDIDHSPRHLLHPSHAGFYTADGLRRLAAHLAPGGVFALWSDDPPDDEFVSTLREVFDDATSHDVFFANPYTGGESANTVYVCRGLRRAHADT